MHTFEQRNAMIAYRRTFDDMPVGDPMSGAAYGEYLKSKGVGMVIGVVAAVAAVWTGGASLGLWAGASGATAVTATTLGAQLAAGAMMAGGVMSGVGIVTGNKNLTKIGGVLSLAGGLGSLLTAPSAAASATGDGLNVAANTVDGVSIGNSTADIAAGAAADGSSTLAGNLAKVQGGSDAAALDVSASAATPTETAIDSGSLGGGAQSNDPSALATTPTPQPAPTSSGTGDGLNVANNTYNGTPIQLPNSGQGILGQAFDGVSKFAKDNKPLIEIAGKAFAKDAQGPEGSAELQSAKAALANAQATTQSSVQAANTAQADALNQKTAAEAQQRKNANTQIVMLDPRDPQYAAKKADAAARGIPTMDMAAPAQAGPVVANGLNWGSNIKAPNVTLPTPQARA